MAVVNSDREGIASLIHLMHVWDGEWQTRGSNSTGVGEGPLGQGHQGSSLQSYFLQKNLNGL